MYVILPNNTLEGCDDVRHIAGVRVVVEQGGQVASAAFRQRVRSQLLLALGRFGVSVRSVTVRLESTSDSRGQVRCSVRMSLELGSVVEAEVFESSVDTALERAVQRAARSVARRIEEGRR